LKFSVVTRIKHASAARWIGLYWKGTRDKGFIIHPNNTRFEVFVDANFSGNWDPKTQEKDKEANTMRVLNVSTQLIRKGKMKLGYYYNCGPAGHTMKMDGCIHATMDL
jgi:hypothetical protein